LFTSLPLTAALLLGAATCFGMSIQMDKLTYQPGDAVQISGLEWYEESAHLVFGPTDGSRPPVSLTLDTNPNDGSFSDQSFLTLPADSHKLFTVLATGTRTKTSVMVPFRVGSAPGSLSCSSLIPYDQTHYGVAPTQKLTCTIQGASDLTPAQQAGSDPVEVMVKTPNEGNLLANVLSVSGQTITFEYTPSANASGSATVGYGPIRACDPISGKCVTFPSAGNYANAATLSGSDATAGFTVLSQGSIPVYVPPGLQVVKSPANGAYAMGFQFHYRIQVTNPTATAATNVLLKDQLPGQGGLYWEFALPTSVCVDPIQNNLLSCNLGTIPPGGTATVDVYSSEMTPRNGCQLQYNGAAIAIADGGLKGYASGSLNCVPQGQLSVQTTPDKGTFSQGDQLHFTIQVINSSSTGTASNVVLTDQLPSNGGLTWLTATTNQGSCSPIVGNALNCSLGNIMPNSTVRVDVYSTPSTPVAACQLQSTMAVATGDGNLYAQDAGSLNCTPTLAPNCAPINAVLGVPIAPVGVTVSGGAATSYSLAASGLPAGLSMSSDGTISGTPTASGSSSYTVTLTDAAGNHATAHCPATVSLPLSAACLTITAFQGIPITPVTMTASGGTGLNYTFAASGLPDGLSMSSSGTISGTPKVSGTFNYQVTITDAAGNTGSLNCSLTVGPASCTIGGVTISNTSWNSFNLPKSGSNPVVWVNGHIGTPSGIPNRKSTVLFTGGVFTLTNATGTTSYSVPDALLTFDPAASGTTTQFVNGRWETTVNPGSLSDEIFFSGLAIPMTADVAAGAKATWSFTVLSQDPALSFPWQWSASAYTSWPADWNQALIRPYHDSHHAGTPLSSAVQTSLIQGPRGGGGSNFTGSWSATGNGSCP